MNADESSSAPMPEADRHAALFSGLVLQQANMAMMFLGQVSRPDGAEQPVDLEAASLFVDTLEMLEAKTMGRLSAAEQELLKSTLTNVRFAFVQVAQRGQCPAPSSTPSPPAADAAPAPSDQPAVSESKASEDDKRRFVKKY
jgi:hypothetical protein